MKFIIVVFFLFLTPFLKGQNSLSIGGYTSLQYTGFTGNPQSVEATIEKKDSQIKWQYGVSVEVPLNNKLLIEAGLGVYTYGQAYGYFGKMYETKGATRKIKLDYIVVPILLKYQVFEKSSFSLYPLIGSALGYKTSVKDNYQLLSTNEKLYNVDKMYTKLNISAISGLLLRKSITKNFSLNLSYLGEIGIIPVGSKNEPHLLGDFNNTKTYSHGLRLGINYHFGAGEKYQ